MTTDAAFMLDQLNPVDKNGFAWLKPQYHTNVRGAQAESDEGKKVSRATEAFSTSMLMMMQDLSALRAEEDDTGASSFLSNAETLQPSSLPSRQNPSLSTRNVLPSLNSFGSLLKCNDFSDFDDLDDTMFNMDLTLPAPNSNSSETPSSHASTPQCSDEGSGSGSKDKRVDSGVRRGSPLLDEVNELVARGQREEWYLDFQEVTLAEKLGEGDCAVVYKARWRSMAVVAKMLRTEHTRYNSCLSASKARADILNEVAILSHLRHPNLVQFLGACFSQDGLFCVLSEYMDNGTLEDYFQKESQRTNMCFRASTERVLSWALDLGQALCFLHNCSPPIIHRDLKPANLLLGAGMKLKVGDFGLSRGKTCESISEGYRMTGLTGTLRYMAPEVMQPEGDGSSEYDEKVDIYSAANIMWYMCMGEHPFGDLKTDTVMAGVIKGLRPDLYSVQRRNGKGIADFIRSGWDADPRLRPSAEAMVSIVKGIRETLRVKDEGKWGKRLPWLLRKVKRKLSSAVGRMTAKDLVNMGTPIADRDRRLHGSSTGTSPKASSLSRLDNFYMDDYLSRWPLQWRVE